MTEINIEKLADLIRYHNELYFNDESEITDAEYDALITQMKSMDPSNPVLSEVGADPSYGKKVTHPSIMGSLNKASYEDAEENISELVEWRKSIKDNEIALMPKIDGLAVRLVYDEKLKLAVTRGNGTVGMDVTDNIKKIKSIPNKIKGFSGELRGEIFMTKSDFEILKKQIIASGEKAPANPRNMASGTVCQKYPKETGKRPLHFFCYDIIIENHSFDSMMDKSIYSEKNLNGIQFVPMTLNSFSYESCLLKEIKEWETKRDDIDYCIDGLVFSANSTEILENLGYKGKCPVGKVAFKFRPMQTTSIIEGITWQLGRTGRLTPVAQIIPIELDGSMIDSPTLHNYAQIQKKDVSVGATVLIEKAGDIIPQVVRVIKKGTGDIDLPTHCTSCLSDVELDEKGVSLWCKNPLCPGKVEFRIIHYLKTLEIKDVGPATVRTMLDNDIINDLPDLYNIDFAKLSSLPGFGKKSAKRVIEEIENKREIELWMFLDSLGIIGLGTTTSKMIADEYKTINNILRIVDVEKLTRLEGIAEKSANYIITGLANLGGTIDSLFEAGVIVKDKKEVVGSLTGKSFCVTGTLSIKRKEMAELIEAAGGIIKSSVSKGLDYLVAGENVGAGKTNKAEKYGTIVISEDEVRAMM